MNKKSDVCINYVWHCDIYLYHLVTCDEKRMNQFDPVAGCSWEAETWMKTVQLSLEGYGENNGIRLLI